MEQEIYQTQLEYFIGNLDYAANIGSGKMLEGLDLRDIAETLGL